MPNGSFEIASVADIPDCWDQYLGPKNVNHWGDFWKICHTESVHGTNSLCVEVPSPSFIGKLYVESCLSERLMRKAHLRKPPKGRNYTLSLWMKSDKQNLPVKIYFQDIKEIMRVGPSWRRFHLTTYIDLREQLKRMRIVPAGTGKVWIDAVQLEIARQPGKFKPSPFDKHFITLPQPLRRVEVEKRLKKLRGLEYGKNSKSYSMVRKTTSLYIKEPDKAVSIVWKRRCILVDRAPFFLFAACFMRAHLYEDRWPKILDMLKSHGYTAVIASFSCRFNDSRASISQVIRFIEMARNRGLMVIPWINPNAIKDREGKFRKVKNGSPDAVLAGYEMELERMIPPLKEHPAILAWYLCDEPGKRDLIHSGFTKRLVEYARKLDKSHPVYINYGALLEDFHFHNGTVPGDIVSRTQYPIPIRPITYIAEQTGLEDIAGQHKKPVVLWLQLWSGNGRYPTPDEFTCMTYLAAIYGATGFQTWPMMPSSRLLWDRVKQVIAEMKELAPFLYESQKLEIDIDGSHYVHTLAKKVKHEYWIVAVNTLDKPQTVKISLPGLSRIEKVKTKFEKRVIRLEGNSIIDNFAPYERHVYVLKKHGGGS